MTDSHLLSFVPDLPRWVETRGMLLTGNYRLMQEVTGSPHFVVSRTDNPLISVVGTPPQSLLKQAIRESCQPVEVVAQIENYEYVTDFLRDWICQPATLFQLAPRIDFSGVSREGVRLLSSKSDIPDDLPSQLASELRTILGRFPVAATFVEDRAVSFCCAESITETLWDISIETLPSYRRKGYAGKCAAFLTEWMRKQKKEPVWSSLDSNSASSNLAKKLGFHPVDRIMVFEKAVSTQTQG